MGLETALGLAVTELVKKNVLSLYQMVEKFSTNPRAILGLPPIRIAEGESANLTIFDPAAQWAVDPAHFKTMSRNTPFKGFRLTGLPRGVINNSQVLWNEA